MSETTTVGTTGYLIGSQFTSIELLYIGNGKFLLLSHEETILGNEALDCRRGRAFGQKPDYTALVPDREEDP